MKRRHGGIVAWFTPLLLALAGAGMVAAAEPVAPVVADRLQFLPPGAVQLEGELGVRIRLGLENRVKAPDLAELVTPFRERRDVTEWRSEFWGKWMTAAASAEQWSQDPALKATMAQAVEALRATQDADGYIGAYTPEHRGERWDWWGRKYVLLGLLGWHEQTGDERALAAARREADTVLAEVQARGAAVFKNDLWGGMAASSILEPMVLLYRRTGDARYREFCGWLMRSWAEPGGPDLVGKAQRGVPVFAMFDGPDPKVDGYWGAGRSKAYEMMSCYEGLLELYRTTGERAFFDAAEKVYRNIADTEITVIGSGSDWERWCDGRARQTLPWRRGIETCVTVTWIKFAGQLLRLTGDSQVADAIELAAYNALLGAQGGDGRWWVHHSPLAGVKERAPEQCDLHQNCCVASGPRGLMLLPQLAVMRDDAGAVVNFYGPARARVPLAGGGEAGLKIEGNYPVGGEVRVAIDVAAPAEFTVQLRIPAWSRRTQVAVNGEAQEGVTAGAYLPLRRTWRAGDVITVTFDLRARQQRAPGELGQVAIVRGPVVLARDARLGGDIDAPLHLGGEDGSRVALTPKPAPAGANVWMCFEVTPREGPPVLLCDFASAGNTWTEASRYRVWSTVE